MRKTAYKKINTIVSLMFIMVLAGLLLSCKKDQPPGHNADLAAPQFSIDLVEVKTGDLPGLHSAAYAVSEGKWLFAGGRIDGVHKFVHSSNGGTEPPTNAFPATEANTALWVIDPSKPQKAWSSPLSALPEKIAAHLSSTNTQYYQDGDTLFIVGGYGHNNGNDMVTHSELTAIKVKETIDAIINGQPVADYIQQIDSFTDCPGYADNEYKSCAAKISCETGPGWEECMKQGQAQCRTSQDESLNHCIDKVQNNDRQEFKDFKTSYYSKVTGGGMRKVGDVYYLVFGQQFDGLYSDNAGDYGKWPINQVYTESITAFHFQADPLSGDVLRVIKQDPALQEQPYHRRDLNVVDAMAPDGSARIAVLGGVFKPGETLAYEKPILIDHGEKVMDTTVSVVENYQQKMSQYETASVGLYSRTADSVNMMRIFLGGISMYKLDTASQKVVYDKNAPFIADITVLSHHQDKQTGKTTWSEYVRAKPMDYYLGADGEFIINPALKASDADLIDYDKIKSKTLLGHMYGGILASKPQSGSSSGAGSTASNKIFEVWLTPTAPAPSYWVNANP